MKDRTTIGISALITIGLIFASMISPTFFETPKYYCEDESSILECPGGLSGGQGTRCYFTKEQNSWDYCDSGWLEITDDRLIQPEPTNDTMPDVSGLINYKCNSKECVRVKLKQP